VVAIDATAAMLAQGQASARAEGHANLVFARGDAAALPFLDGSFDIVVCRFAVHHFTDPALPLAEMRRCLRAGGRLCVADLIADPDPATAAVQNELERRRDPSHTRMLAAQELAAAVGGPEMGDVDVEIRSLMRPLDAWLEQARTPADVASAIRVRLNDELSGGPVTGFGPETVDGELHFRQTFASCLAVRNA
jgi:ubiquinone/menaquinone biosynthesis C-methylase UbiE